MGEVLFSKTQRQVLGLLFGNPDRSYYANEIVRFAGVGIGSVQRELERLSRAGLLSVTQIGNQKHYRANPDAPIYDELRGIVLKTFGLAGVLREALSAFSEKIAWAFVYGSVAKGTDTARSDIDLMVVSNDLSYSDLAAPIAHAEGRLGRKVNPTLYKPGDFAKRLAADNAFVGRVSKQPKIFLIGSEDDIPKP